MPKCIILIAAVSLFSILHFTTLNGDLDPPCQLVKWQWELNSLYSGLMDHPDIFYWARTAAPGRPACCSEVIGFDAEWGTFPRRDARQTKRKIMSKHGVILFLFLHYFCWETLIISLAEGWFTSLWKDDDDYDDDDDSAAQLTHLKNTGDLFMLNSK